MGCVENKELSGLLVLDEPTEKLNHIISIEGSIESITQQINSNQLLVEIRVELINIVTKQINTVIISPAYSIKFKSCASGFNLEVITIKN